MKFNHSSNSSLNFIIVFLFCLSSLISSICHALPTPVIQIISESGSILRGEAITLDFSQTSQFIANTTYYFMIETMESTYFYNMTAGTETASTSGKTNIYFNLPGRQEFTVYMSDNPFTRIQGATRPPLYTSTTSENLFPFFQKFIVQVAHEKACYRYYINKTIPKNFSDPIDVNIGVQSGYNLDQSSNHSFAFASIGEEPVLTLSNATHEYKFTSVWSEDEMNWKISLPREILQNNTEYLLKVASHWDSVLSSCSVKPNWIGLSASELTQTKLGYTFNTSKLQELKDLLDAGYDINKVKLVTDICNNQNKLALLPSTLTSKNYSGAIVAFSTNGFRPGSASVADLTRLKSFSRRGNLCAELSTEDCRDLTIFDATMVHSTIFLLTSSGLFKSNPPITDSTGELEISWTKISLKSSAFSSLKLLMTTECNVYENGYLMVVGLTQNYHEAFSLKIKHPTDVTLTPTDSIVDLNNIEQVVSIAENSAGDLIVLVGTKLPNVDCDSFNVCPFDHAKVFSYNSKSKEKALVYTFNDTAHVVTGMEFHGNQHDLFVYGSRIWASIDLGNNFVSLKQLDGAPSEYVSQFSSSDRKENFAVLSNQGNVYYGRVGAPTVISLGNKGSPTLNALDILDDGAIYMISFDILSRGNGLYPYGIFNDAEGNIRGQSNSFYKRNKLVLDAFLPEIDHARSFALTPVDLGANKMLFYAWDINNSTAQYPFFQLASVGDTIFTNNPDDKGALVTDLNTLGNIIQAHISELHFKSICQLTTSSLNATYNEQIAARQAYIPSVEFKPSLETVTLNLNQLNGFSGWTPAHVGKSLVLTAVEAVIGQNEAFEGSILLDKFVNATTIMGKVISYTINSANEAETSFSSNRWMICDYGAFETLDISGFSESGITFVTEPFPSPLTRVKLDSGQAFDIENVQGSILSTNTGEALVQYSSEGDLLVSPIQTLSSVTSTAGNWLLKRGFTLYMSNRTAPNQNELKKSWRMVSSSCRWQAFDDEVQSRVHYIPYKSSILWNSSFKLDSSTNSISEKTFELFTLLINPGALDNNVMVHVDQIEGVAKVQVLLQDTGAGSTLGISVRPSDVSLTCYGPFHSSKIVSSCPPTRILRVIHEDHEYYELPFNYRPPSHFGRNIPVTSNFYNGAPDQPKYDNWHPMAQSSGQYKQCFGKSKASECLCTNEQEHDYLIDSSDCIKEVPLVHFHQKYHPVLKISQYGAPDKIIDASFSLRELNGRRDYCFSSITDCKDKSLLNKTLFGADDVITWDGPGLYHFKVELEEEDYCKMSAEFALYVVGAYSTTAEVSQAMAITSFTFFVWLITIYVYFR